MIVELRIQYNLLYSMQMMDQAINSVVFVKVLREPTKFLLSVSASNDDFRNSSSVALTTVLGDQIGAIGASRG